MVRKEAVVANLNHYHGIFLEWMRKKVKLSLCLTD
jgi:hypothetical protein